MQWNQEGDGAAEPHPCAQELAEKFQNRAARLAVVGLGYVGLSLATEMARAGFEVTGIDNDPIKIGSVNLGNSYVLDIPSEILRSLVSRDKIKATQSSSAVKNVDAISICVPTPLGKSKEPDLSYVVAAVEAIGNHLKQGQLVVVESTTYPGTTRELVLPILQKTGLRVGRDFFLAFSPERVDPSNLAHTTRTIPKVIGGVTPQCGRLAGLLYQQFVDKIVQVSSPECAEMAKLLENTFRNVNIALVNEMAIMCREFGVDVWEVIDAAKSKPFGYMPFYPGPGLGGQCIPVDPYYLTWKARLNGCEPRLIELAAQINSQMPAYTVGRIVDALNERRQSLKSAKILGLGVAYKHDTSDIRESPALEVLQRLLRKGACVSYSDPHVTSIQLQGQKLQSLPVTAELLNSMDCVVLLTDHSGYDYQMISAHSPVIVDCRNAFRDFPRSNIVCL